jgi:Leucine Rich repeat
MNDDNNVEHHQLDDNMLVALKRFQRNDNDANDTGRLWMHNVNFNRATLLHLVAFFTTTGRTRKAGRSNSISHNRDCCTAVIQQLNLSTCKFDDESLKLFCSFLSNNTFPGTLEQIHLERCLQTQNEERCLLISLHTNTTIKILSFHGSNNSNSSIQGEAGGAIMAALLLQNSALTTIDLVWSFDDVAFIRALKEGIISAMKQRNTDDDTSSFTSCHLQSMALHRMNSPNNETLFDKLQLVFIKKKNNATITGQQDTTVNKTTTTTTITSTTTITCLNLCHSFDPNATTTLKQLRKFLLTMPGLMDLNVTDNWLNVAPHTLLQGRMRQQLQKLNLSNCNINHTILDQMSAAAAAVAAVAIVVPGSNDGGHDNNDNESTSAALVELNLSRNKIQGRRGGTSLGCFLLESRAAAAGGVKLKTLILSSNILGSIGAQTLAPALIGKNHAYLQHLNLSSCRIQDGAIIILKTLTTRTTTANTMTTISPSGYGSGCLRSLDLSDNLLPPATLTAVSEYLKHSSSRHLQELYLSENNSLFKSFSSSSSSNDQGSSFFDAVANHKAMKILHVCNVGMNEQQTKRPLLSAMLYNTILLQVQHSMTTTSVQNVIMEYIRRNHLHAKMKATMDQPVNIPCALWPLALEVCSSLFIGPTIAFCLVQKMMESNVFSYVRNSTATTTAAVHWLEK